MKRIFILILLFLVACSTSKKVSKQKDRSPKQKVYSKKADTNSSHHKQQTSNNGKSQGFKLENNSKPDYSDKNKIEEIKGLPKEERNSIKHKLVTNSSKYIGIPYRLGGETPKGFDCSGFAKYVYNSVGVEIPRVSGDQAKLGKEVDLEVAAEGDLIFFGKKKGKKIDVTHTGIIYANKHGKISIIHSSSKGIVIEEVGSYSWNSYFKDRFLFVKRIF